MTHAEPTRRATCSCGALSVLCQGEPNLVSLCHCIACQKRTGTPYGIAAFFQRDRVEIDGEYRSYTRSSDSGFGIVFHFCGTCGSTVLWKPSRKPDWIAVAPGAFGDPDFPAPSQEVHTDCRHDWIRPLDV